MCAFTDCLRKDRAACTDNLSSQRDGLRKKRHGRRPPARTYQQSQTRSHIRAESPLQDTGSTAASLPQQCNSFASHCTALPSGGYPELAAPSNSITPSLSHLRSDILEPEKASILPKPSLMRAWADAYMTYGFYYCPVAEPKDLSGPDRSILLRHGICLVGNMMRHDPSGPKLAEAFYEKIKLLISINHEHDMVRTLQTLCLLTCWHGKASDPVTLDGPWHWTGVALRLTIQLGLHREATYARRPDAASLRRIFWYLQVRYSSETYKSITSCILTQNSRTATPSKP